MPFDYGIFYGILPFMTAKISIDKAGRVVLPKALRDEMRVEPGDDFLVESKDDLITLRPVRPKALLKKEHGIWVYHGEPSDVSIPDLIDTERKKRIREFID